MSLVADLTSEIRQDIDDQSSPYVFTDLNPAIATAIEDLPQFSGVKGAKIIYELFRAWYEPEDEDDISPTPSIDPYHFRNGNNVKIEGGNLSLVDPALVGSIETTLRVKEITIQQAYEIEQKSFENYKNEIFYNVRGSGYLSIHDYENLSTSEEIDGKFYVLVDESSLIFAKILSNTTLNNGTVQYSISVDGGDTFVLTNVTPDSLIDVSAYPSTHLIIKIDITPAGGVSPVVKDLSAFIWQVPDYEKRRFDIRRLAAAISFDKLEARALSQNFEGVARSYALRAKNNRKAVAGYFDDGTATAQRSGPPGKILRPKKSKYASRFYDDI